MLRGRRALLCAEYCGKKHSAMLSSVVTVPVDSFDVWILDGGGRPTGLNLATIKGCVSCHTSDGSKLVGPSFKGLFGRTERVETDGQVRELVVDDAHMPRTAGRAGTGGAEAVQALLPHPLQGDGCAFEIVSVVQEDKLCNKIQY